MAKSATFGVIHLGIAFGVTFTLTGELLAAGLVALLEPIANTVAFGFFDRRWEQAGMGSGWIKSLVFGGIHMLIAFAVTYVLTGHLLAATAQTLVEPVLNVVALVFFERWWQRSFGRNVSAAAPAVG